MVNERVHELPGHRLFVGAAKSQGKLGWFKEAKEGDVLYTREHPSRLLNINDSRLCGHSVAIGRGPQVYSVPALGYLLSKLRFVFSTHRKILGWILVCLNQEY